MKTFRLIALQFVICTAPALAQDFLDRIDESLTLTAAHDNVRVHLSGLLDLEFFRLDQPPLGLINTDDRFLF